MPDAARSGNWIPDTSNNFTPLLTFMGAQGADPDGNLTIKGDQLYGTTYSGGAANQGTLFRVKTDGTDYKPLHNFTGGDGEHPDSTPRFDSNGNLFSVAPFGGAGFTGTNLSGFGVLYELSNAGLFSVQHYFSGGADGGTPQRLFLNSSGTIFGSTFIGGSCTGTGLPAAGCGTVFSFVPSTGQFTTLYTFTGTSDGYEALLAGVDTIGNLYGATIDGGANGYGTLFELSPNTSGGYTYVHLYDFTGGADGAYPGGNPALLPGGALVGVTEYGPVTKSSQGSGVLYVLNFTKSKFTTLFTFLNDVSGGYPSGTPVVTGPDLIAGTTGYGGREDSPPCNTSGGTLISSFGCGTVWVYNLAAPAPTTKK
jgi:uncharacterized repeat protein (TIGR03803 family)